MKTKYKQCIHETVFRCLYPTFKEWKRRPLSTDPEPFSSVYILPLRNENQDAAGTTPIASGVYILPLRNENR